MSEAQIISEDYKKMGLRKHKVVTYACSRCGSPTERHKRVTGHPVYCIKCKLELDAQAAKARERERESQIIEKYIETVKAYLVPEIYTDNPMDAPLITWGILKQAERRMRGGTNEV